MKLLVFFLCSLLLTLECHATIDWPQVVEEFSRSPQKYQAREVSGGASNINYHILIDEAHYFVRLAPKATASLYADIGVEYEVLESLSGLGVSPKPHYFDPERRLLISDFLLHDEEQIDLLDSATRGQVFSLLHQIEESGIKISRTFCPYNDVFNLVETAKKRGCEPFPEPFYQQLLPRLKEVDAALSKNPKKSLCHLDLHNKNILKTDERFWIIDWEYAAMSHPFLVLASMASIEHWDDQQMLQVLHEYSPSATKEDFCRLYLWRIVADLFWTAWNHVQDHCSTIDNPYGEWERQFYEAACDRIHSQYYPEAIRCVDCSLEVILLFGPPGSGKGTFSQYAKEKGYGHVSAGDLVREEIHRKTAIGRAIEEVVRRGEYIDQQTMFDLVKDRAMQFVEADQPFIIDGYGRNLPDAERLRTLVRQIDAQVLVVFLEASDATCTKRILDRLVCSKCCMVYNRQFGLELESDCPHCLEGKLQGRLYDTPEVIAKRLKTYREETHPCYSTFLNEFTSVIFNTDCDLQTCYSYYDALFGNQ